MLFGLLGLFVVGTVAYTSNVTAMAFKMALANGSSTDMGECGDCDRGNGVKSNCDLVCVAPLLANITADAPFLPPHSALPATIKVANFVGRTGPPDHNPPRHLILN